MAKIYYVGDWAVMLGPVFAETPFNYAAKGTEIFNYGKWLKAALESLTVDHGFDAEGNLLWLGLGSLAVTDEALAKLADETKLHALYLYDTKITDAGLKHLSGLTGLRLLLLTATPVTDAGVAELEAALPECVVVR